MKLITAAVVSAVTLGGANAQTPHDRLTYEHVIADFNRGRNAMRLCSYTIADYGAHLDCSLRTVYGNAKSTTMATADGANFQEFLDDYAINSVFTMPHVFGLDKRIREAFKGSVRGYCTFYQVDCGPLVQWYQENQSKFPKDVRANVD